MDGTIKRKGATAAGGGIPKRWSEEERGLLVGVVANLDKPRALALATELLGWLRAQGHEPIAVPELAEAVAWGGAVETLEALAGAVGLLVVLGGDGTLLAAATRVAERGAPPIVGINVGHLGFLTEIEQADVYRALPEFLAGRYVLDERAMLCCRVLPSGDEYLALNDVVVAKGPPARSLRIRTRVDGVRLDAFVGDGVIVATPTGSTAYALAAGGPVLHPCLSALVVAPICPHTFSSRPTVVSVRDIVGIEAECERGTTVLTLDGQRRRSLLAGEQIEVRLSDRVTRLLRRPGWNFYEVVRRKLAEGDAGEGTP